MEEGNSLVEFSGVGNYVFGVLTEYSLFYNGRGVILFALDSQLSDTLLKFEIASRNGLLQ